MRIVPMVTAAIAATSCARPPAPPPVQPVANRAPEVRTGADPCTEAHRIVRLDRLSQAEGVQYHMRPEDGLSAESDAALIWSADINDDRVADVALRLADSCGAYSECLIAAFVGCGHGRYAWVLPPDSRLEVELGATTTPVDGRVWTDLIETSRYRYDTESPHPLRFDGDRYR